MTDAETETVTLEQAAGLAGELATTLRWLANDEGWAGGASRSLEKLTAAIPSLRAELAARWHAGCERAIANAGDLALTHDWYVNEGVIECRQCQCWSERVALRLGQVPECGGDQCRLGQHSIGPLHDTADNRRTDASGCTFCKAEYPTTAASQPAQDME